MTTHNNNSLPSLRREHDTDFCTTEGVHHENEDSKSTPEHIRLQQATNRTQNWKRWGTYLSERQWATVREDYSPYGDSWDYLPHDHARSRAYRWGEDGLMGICDRECRMCFSIAVWNTKDPILKERLFGLTGSEGNHGEDVKELYFYTDSSPTQSYSRGLYKYPIAEYPYAWLVSENRARDRSKPEFEIYDTGVFDNQRYFDVEVEYAKQEPDDICIRITAHNRSNESAPLHILPTGWFRNTWSWGIRHEGNWPRPSVSFDEKLNRVETNHESLGQFFLACETTSPNVKAEHATQKPEWLFTENETNNERLWGSKNVSPYVKDA